MNYFVNNSLVQNDEILFFPKVCCVRGELDVRSQVAGVGIGDRHTTAFLILHAELNLNPPLAEVQEFYDLADNISGPQFK